MTRHGWSILIALCAGFAGLAGCGSSEDEFNVDAIPLMGDPGFETASDAESRATSSDHNVVQTASLDEGRLAFSLKVNERFPLKKTIEQTLVQDSPEGPISSTSKLTLLFAIRVEEEDQGRRRLAVRYQRVTYQHDVLGERVTYDSMNPPEYIPDELQVYHGLASNGFSFWVGADNRIIEVLAFDDFLKRCVRFAPEHQRDVLLTRIVAAQNDEGFANFVDDSIGLLPYDASASSGRETTVKVGHVWQRKKTIMRPLPMDIMTTYTLSNLSEKLAQVAVFGTIEPATATELGPNEQVMDQQMLTLRGGFVTGTIAIDRENGLPLNSRVERNMQMSVQSPGHPPFLQQKKVVTTVEAFPTAGTSYSSNEWNEPGAGQSDRPVIRAGAENTADQVINADFATPQ